MPKRRDPKSDPFGTEELFPATLGQTETEGSEERRKPVRSLRQGKCPCCTANRTGLVLVGDHLVWRWHTYVTWSGTRLLCRASGVAVCVAPERNPINPTDPARCAHRGREMHEGR